MSIRKSSIRKSKARKSNARKSNARKSKARKSVRKSNARKSNARKSKARKSVRKSKARKSKARKSKARKSKARKSVRKSNARKSKARNSIRKGRNSIRKGRKSLRKRTKSLRKRHGFRMVPRVVNEKFMEDFETKLEIHRWPRLKDWEDLNMHDLAGGDIQATDKIIEILKSMGVEKGKNITIKNLEGKQCTFVLEQVNVYSNEYKSRDHSIILAYSFGFYNNDGVGGDLHFILSLDPENGLQLRKEYKIVLDKRC
jgi:hypothetical protein